jgi:hypothetical protein
MRDGLGQYIGRSGGIRRSVSWRPKRRNLSMPTQDDVRRIALSLPETTEDPRWFRFFVDGKQFAWSWMERLDPKRARVPSREVIAVRVAGEMDKQVLLDLDPSVFFTEPHYDGYPAILVRLPAIDPELLREILARGWRSRAPKRLLK